MNYRLNIISEPNNIINKIIKTNPNINNKIYSFNAPNKLLMKTLKKDKDQDILSKKTSIT
jgi:hypothetical protein